MLAFLGFLTIILVLALIDPVLGSREKTDSYICLWKFRKLNFIWRTSKMEPLKKEVKGKQYLKGDVLKNTR